MATVPVAQTMPVGGLRKPARRRDGCPALGGTQAAMDDEGGIEAQARLGQRPPVAQEPVLGEGEVARRVDQRDPAAALLGQVAGRLPGRELVVDVVPGVRREQLGAAEGDEGEAALQHVAHPLVLRRGAGQDEPVGELALDDPAHPVEPLHARQEELDHGGIGGPLEPAAHALDDRGHAAVADIVDMRLPEQHRHDARSAPSAGPRPWGPAGRPALPLPP